MDKDKLERIKAFNDFCYDCDKCMFRDNADCYESFLAYRKGRADALVEKKYIIKEDGSIHSLDKDIEDAYNRGRADREKEVLTYLVNNGYIKYGFDEEYLAEQLKEKKK